jgi:hypothetical protein
VNFFNTTLYLIATRQDAGPFAAYDEVTAWLYRTLDVAKRCSRMPVFARFRFIFPPLVFTHFDIGLSKMIWGAEDRLYLVDLKSLDLS